MVNPSESYHNYLHYDLPSGYCNSGTYCRKVPVLKKHHHKTLYLAPPEKREYLTTSPSTLKKPLCGNHSLKDIHNLVDDTQKDILVCVLKEHPQSARQEINTLDKHGNTLLSKVISAKQNATAEILIHAGADVQSKVNEWSPLAESIYYNLPHVAYCLIKHGAPLDQHSFGKPVLDLAAQKASQTGNCDTMFAISCASNLDKIKVTDREALSYETQNCIDLYNYNHKSKEDLCFKYQQHYNTDDLDILSGLKTQNLSQTIQSSEHL